MTFLLPLRIGLLACALFSWPAFAQTLPTQSGPTILTVTGLDPARFAGGSQVFDLAMLKALPQDTFSTTSIWTDGSHTFKGVPLAALVAYLGMTGTTLSLHAINDYSIKMPLNAVEPQAPLLAYQMDGVPMTIRDKGPIWVIYPYDSAARYRTDTTYSRSVWQLDRIDVLR